MDLFAEDDQHREDTEKREGCPDYFERLFFDASAVDAKDTEVVTRGCPSAGAEGATVDRDRVLFDLLENALDAYQVKGTKSRINLDPKAPRDECGRHVNIVPSDMITGPDPDRGQDIWHLAKLMNPDFPFTAMTVNKFRPFAHPKDSKCKKHIDSENDGSPRLVLFGNFTGGGLKLDDGRNLVQKRYWHEYDGSVIPHEVLPFEGKRTSLVL